RPDTERADMQRGSACISYPRRHPCYARNRSAVNRAPGPVWKNRSILMSFLAIIPARRHSLRLPDKPLLDIAGAPMVVRTAQQAARSKAERVVVATDDPCIQTIVTEHGFDAIL